MKTSSFKTILVQELIREKWIPILLFSVTFILHFLIEFIEFINNSYQYSFYQITYSTTLIGMFLIVTYIFSYMHSQNKIDFIHSMPLTRKKIFLLNYIKGLLYFTIPALTMVILLYIYDIFVFSTEIISVSFMLNILIYWLVIVFMYTVFVLSNVITGLTLFSVLGGFFLLISPFIIDITWYNNSIFYAYYQSTFQVAHNNLSEITFLELFITTKDIKSYVEIIIILLCSICLLAYLSYKVYKSRKSENTSVVVAIEYLKLPLKVILSFTFTFLITSVLLDFLYDNFISFLMLLGLIYAFIILIFEMIISMGIKKITPKSYIKTLVLTIILNIIFLNIPYITEFSKYELEDIEVININIANDYERTNYNFLIENKEDISELFDYLYTENESSEGQIFVNFGYYTDNNYKYLARKFFDEESFKLFEDKLLEFDILSEKEAFIYYFKVENQNFYVPRYTPFNNNSYKNTYPSFDEYRKTLNDTVSEILVEDYINDIDSDLELPLAYVYGGVNTYAPIQINKNFENTLEYLRPEDIIFVLYDIDKNFSDNFDKDSSRYQKVPFYYEDNYNLMLNNYKVSSFTAQDVIDEKIKLKIFEGEVTVENYEKYDLKLVQDDTYFYFVTIEE